MKILHTSDWHLGKLFYEKSLIEDQEYVLNQIIDIAKKAEEEGSPYGALVVSGDIYDRAIPPADASKLLNRFLVKIREEVPSLHIFMNAGNHDSASRLSFASDFLEYHKIHLATGTENICQPVILEQGEEKLAVYQLPFLTPLSIKEDNAACSTGEKDLRNADCDFGKNAEGLGSENKNNSSPEGAARAFEKSIEDSDQGTSEENLRSQEDLYRAACKKILESHRKNYPGIPSLLNAHLFTSGSLTGASERSNVGTVEQVSVSLFKDFTYGAFGHIHKFQSCDEEKKCWYSGSLLPYNFDDSPESGILEVDIGETVSVKRLLFTPLHKISKINAFFKDLFGSEADKNLVKENQNNYVQVILKDSVMPTEAFFTLKTVFPYLLSVIQASAGSRGTSSSIEQRKAAILSNDPEKIFDQFMTDLYGEEVTGGKQAASSQKEGESQELNEERGLFEAEKKIFIEEASKSVEM